MEEGCGLRPEFLLHHFMCLCGSVAHIMLLIVFIKNPLKCFRNSPTYLLASLAISDTVYSSIAPVDLYWHIVERYRLLDVGTTTSFISTFAIAADRYFMVTRPLKHRIHFNRKRTAAWLAFIWSLGLCSPVKRTFFADNMYEEHITNAFGLAFILATTFIYLMAFRSLKMQARLLASQDVSSVATATLRSRVLKEKKFLVTIVITVIAAGITLAPMVLYEIIDFRKDGYYRRINRIVSTVLLTVFSLNFVINPFIYFWRMPNVRRTFYVLYCRKLGLNS